MIEVPQKKDFLRTSVFIHPAILVRAEVMQKLGGYSTETCALRTEDYELFMRLYAAGERGYNLQEFLFRYREDVHAFSKSARQAQVKKKTDNKDGTAEGIKLGLDLSGWVCPLLTGFKDKNP